MRFGISATVTAVALGLLTATASTAKAADEAKADMINAEGKTVGTVTLKDTRHGTLLHAKLDGLPPGEHAFHVHAVGKCETPSFMSAGDHYDPSDKRHGILAENGMHAGDLPNIYVPAIGSLELDVFATDLELDNELLGGDGA